MAAKPGMILSMGGALALMVTVALPAVAAVGARAGVSPSPATSSAAARATIGTTGTMTVAGFRSATFGMTEAQVRAAIDTDFGIKGHKILTGRNPAERTNILSVNVPGLIPNGGSAQVSYIFGYRSKKLIQVGISWSRKSDPKMTAKMLYDDGDVLRAHFMSAGYKPSSVRTNAALPNGLLMFRGEGASGHATVLLLQGSFKAAKSGRKLLTPSSLDLLYSENPLHPDVFRLKKGAF